MLGVSYGELFLLLGATAALIGPKDLPLIARTAGRLAGRAIGYVQLARGQFDSVMQQTQARQVHKELQDTIAQLEAIRYEIRSISMVNPAPMTRRLVDTPSPNPETSSDAALRKLDVACTASEVATSGLLNVHRQATDFAKLAESSALQASMTGSVESDVDSEKLTDQLGLLEVLPVSAENTGMLPKHSGDILGSDILLDAILEAEVAHKAKEFFLQPQNQIPMNKEKIEDIIIEVVKPSMFFHFRSSFCRIQAIALSEDGEELQKWSSSLFVCLLGIAVGWFYDTYLLTNNSSLSGQFGRRMASKF